MTIAKNVNVMSHWVSLNAKNKHIFNYLQYIYKRFLFREKTIMLWRVLKWSLDL